MDNCSDTAAFNNLTSSEECIEKFNAIPTVFTGTNHGFDGYDKGCRLLHAAFAIENPDHCAHVSFAPMADPKGRIKCQASSARYMSPMTGFTEPLPAGVLQYHYEWVTSTEPKWRWMDSYKAYMLSLQPKYTQTERAQLDQLILLAAVMVLLSVVYAVGACLGAAHDRKLIGRSVALSTARSAPSNSQVARNTVGYTASTRVHLHQQVKPPLAPPQMVPRVPVQSFDGGTDATNLDTGMLRAYRTSYQVKTPTGNEVNIIRHVSVQIHPGLTAIMGPSGSGKTTMLDFFAGRLIGGSIRGRLYYDDGVDVLDPQKHSYIIASS